MRTRTSDVNPGNLEKWLDSFDPETTPTRDATHLRAIGKALTALEKGERNLEEAVQAAHDAGESWALSAPSLVAPRRQLRRG